MLGNGVIGHFVHDSMSFKGSQSAALVILLVWGTALQSLVLTRASEGCLEQAGCRCGCKRELESTSGFVVVAQCVGKRDVVAIEKKIS